MFTFKHFKIEQERAAMKVGTDGVLLGAWATPPPDTTKILDIGSGTGLIALMLAQRFERCNIDAVEIDTQSCSQAEDNVYASPWSDRITLYNLSIQQFVDEFKSEKYEFIVSNPPYFTNSLKCPDQNRRYARHNDSLPLEELLYCSSKILSDKGILSLILPTQEGEELIAISSKFGFTPMRECRIFPTVSSKAPKRLLIELCLNTDDTTCHIDDLTIEMESRFDYTKEYIELTKDFYLKF